jgi:serine O-acetyltransferase
MVLALHFISHWLWRHRIPVLPRVIQGVIRVFFAVAIPPSVKFGRGVTLGYSGLGTVIHARATIGDRVNIGSCVTIGGRSGHYDVPVIEEGVDIGSGAKILGPIRLGAGSVIGANAVVITDVPPQAVVVGVPARVIKFKSVAKDLSMT